MTHRESARALVSGRGGILFLIEPCAVFSKFGAGVFKEGLGGFPLQPGEEEENHRKVEGAESEGRHLPSNLTDPTAIVTEYRFVIALPQGPEPAEVRGFSGEKTSDGSSDAQLQEPPRARNGGLE